MPCSEGAPNVSPIIRNATQSFILRQALLQKLLSRNFPSDSASAKCEKFSLLSQIYRSVLRINLVETNSLNH